MPSFCLGLGARSVGWGDGGLPRYELAVHDGLARGLLEGLIACGHDVAFARNLPLDHAFMTPIHLLFPQADLPIVPLFQNCVAPPLPTVGRCLQLGGALRGVLAGIEPGLRVALIGTGGLSHEVPLHDWRSLPDDETGRAWLAFMSAGRAGADPETGKRIAAEVDRWGREGPGRIDEDFDRELLAWMQVGTYKRLADLDTATIARRGGNGAQEIRNWATVMGAVPDTRGVLFYGRAAVADRSRGRGFRVSGSDLAVARRRDGRLNVLRSPPFQRGAGLPGLAVYTGSVGWLACQANQYWVATGTGLPSASVTSTRWSG